MALQHLHSSTANKRPTPGAMSVGQLAINLNTASPGLFFKDSAGALIKVGPVHVGTTAPNASPASGGETGNTVGEQWLDTTGGTYVFKVWDGSAWRSESGTFVDVNGDVMTGALGIIAGSAGSPGLYFSGDTNTGLYSPGADQVAISTGGSGRLFVDASGNVGVGQTPKTWDLLGSGRSIQFPTASIANFDNYGAGNYQLQLLLNAYRDGSGTYRYLKSSGVASQYTQNNGGDHLWYTAPSGTADAAITFSERLRITSAGLVGVGTSAPSTTLSVAGGISGTAGANISGAGWGVLPYVANSLVIDNNAGEARFFATGANATTRGSFIFYNGETDGGAGAAMVIDSSGRVGVGTTSPVCNLDVFTASSATEVRIRNNTDGLRLVANTDGTQLIRSVFNYGLVFGTGTSSTNDTFREAFRVDSSQRLLIGTSSARSNFYNGGFSAGVQLEGADASRRLSITGADEAGVVILARQRSGSTGGNTILANNDGIGVVTFQGSDGAEFVEAATIKAEVDGTPGANDMPGRIVLSTTAAGASSPTERMRITSAGKVLVNSTTTTYTAPVFGIRGEWEQTIPTYNNGDTFVRFLSGTQGSATTRGAIETNGTSVLYNTASDARLKKNIKDSPDSGALLDAVQVRAFDWKESGVHQEFGFVAQELRQVYPQAVSSPPDDRFLGVDYGQLVPLLVKEIQSLRSRVAALESA